ncbi:uncharacterized protein [Watersipora subatra]|uniref:uncharacterized protein isoform X2 n=1 Tax=Watersipora subatra TaxID=2589382 RepID=UPI00355B0964
MFGLISPLTVYLKLFYDIVPRTAENFRYFCEQKSLRERYSYKGTKFRVIPNFICQGGDFSRLNPFGSKSKYGYFFEDENFTVKHDRRGIVSMANNGRNKNMCQFFIIADKIEWLDGKHVAFGIVKKGFDILDKMFELGQTNGIAKKPIQVVDCGEVLDEEGERRLKQYIIDDKILDEKIRREDEIRMREIRMKKEADERALIRIQQAKRDKEKEEREAKERAEREKKESKDGMASTEDSSVEKEATSVEKDDEESTSKEGTASTVKAEGTSTPKEREILTAKDGEASAGEKGETSTEAVPPPKEQLAQDITAEESETLTQSAELTDPTTKESEAPKE